MSNPPRQPARTDSPLDRIPPNSREAEMAVLGAILLNPNEAGATARDRLREDQFYYAAHQVLFREIAAMHDLLKTVDLVTLTQRLRDKALLEEVGGPAYLTDLITRIPTTAHIEHYIDIVVEKALLRQCITIGAELVDGAFEQHDDVPAFLDAISQKLYALTAARQERGMVPAAEFVQPALTAIGAELENRGITGLTTGLTDLDVKIGGLKPRLFYVIAARPGAGKTTLAMNIAEHVVLELGVPVGVFTLEMGNEELVKRLLCSRARFNVAAVRDKHDQSQDLSRLTMAADAVKGAALYLDDTAQLTVQQIRSRARRLVQTHGVGLIVVDYLQLVKSTTRRQESKRVDELTDISGGLNALKKDLNIPVIVCAQLNRLSEFRSEGMPKLSDLRECGAIEQDADVAILLHRPEMHADSAEDRRALYGKAAAIIAKQRGGPTGEVPLVFFGAQTRFGNAAKEG